MLLRGEYWFSLKYW